MKLSILTHIILFLFMSSSQALQKDQDRANEWVSKQAKSFFDSCKNAKKNDAFKRLSFFETQFMDEIASIPLESLKSFKRDSAFIEVGAVLFPEHLPKSYPMRGAYLICFEVHREFKMAIKPDERKQKLKELEDCYNNAYQASTAAERPNTVNQVLSCYQSLE